MHHVAYPLAGKGMVFEERGRLYPSESGQYSLALVTFAQLKLPRTGKLDNRPAFT